MLAFLAGLPWGYPQDAQIFVKEQGDNRFQLWVHDGTSFIRILDGLPDRPR